MTVPQSSSLYPIRTDRAFPRFLDRVLEVSPDRWQLADDTLVLRTGPNELHLTTGESPALSIHLAGHEGVWALMSGTDYPQVTILAKGLTGVYSNLVLDRSKLLDDLLAELDALG